jgi:hypothetical protein
MKALIERSLYQPSIVLPILMLVRLMTALDFSVTQIVLVLAFKGTRYVFMRFVMRSQPTQAPAPAQCAQQDAHCHC